MEEQKTAIERMVRFLETEYESARMNKDLYQGRIMAYADMRDYVKNMAMEMPLEHDECEGCRYENKEASDWPCKLCKQTHLDRWEARDDT